MGFLYGRYEQHKDLPLAIRAVVTAIYEPPQVSLMDGLRLYDLTYSTVSINYDDEEL